tara:strand:+ start:4222 stop:4482 length:261 start_codon:yes stop_codon:yes gene_type:complete
LLQINNIDHGIWLWIQAISFNRTFTDDEQDKNLGSKPTRVTSWNSKLDNMVCLDIQKQGLNPLQIVLEQVGAYMYLNINYPKNDTC